MYAIVFVAWFALWMLATGTGAFPNLRPSRMPHGNNHSLNARDNLPPIPMRPASSGSNSFHGHQFEYLQHMGYAPAVDAMPVFLYSRTTKAFVRNPENRVEVRE